MKPKNLEEAEIEIAREEARKEKREEYVKEHYADSIQCPECGTVLKFSKVREVEDVG